MNFIKIFESFNNQDILIIGDVMIDSYVEGRVDRVSPEAPVPIVNLSKKENRLGGAANVAFNISSMGANPIICSVVGNDQNASVLEELLENEDLSVEGVQRSNERMTTVKTRVIGNHQQLVRIDEENTHYLSSEEESLFIARIQKVISDNNVKAIVFQDYNKGVLTESLIHHVISIANQNNILTTVDPKKDNFYSYKGVTLFKPNLKELKEGMGLDFSDLTTGVRESAKKLKEIINASIIFTTLSEKGVYIVNDENDEFIPAHIRNISDVSGAGDTVISVATLCLVAGLEIRWIAELANLAGGLVCEKSGVVSINKKQLLDEVLKLYA